MNGKRNLPASVAARLLALAKQGGEDYQTVLGSFCFERFLYRLGGWAVRERFVLKGAMLLRLWSDQPYRATRDLDLLRQGDRAPDAVRNDLRVICTAEAPPDGVEFEPEALRLEVIRPEDEYAGTRALLPARCYTARVTLQIDMGLGDSVWPAPRPCTYPIARRRQGPRPGAHPGGRPGRGRLPRLRQRLRPAHPDGARVVRLANG